MNLAHCIGEVTLNFTALIYIIWQIPQFMHNIQQKTNNNLSIKTHLILLLGYVVDLVYGFGEQLPLQYKIVTISGLICLVAEHCQVWVYWKYDEHYKSYFILFTVLLFLCAIKSLLSGAHTKNYYNICAIIAWLCWLSCLWPQLYANYRAQNVTGISCLTATLAMLTGIGDVISSFTLAWPLMSKLALIGMLIPRTILMVQLKLYKK